MIEVSVSPHSVRPGVPVGVCALAVLCVSFPLAAQAAPSGMSAPVAAHGLPRDSLAAPRRLIRRSDALLLAGALATSAIVSRFDGAIETEIREPELQERSALNHTSALASSFGGPGPLAVGLVTYAAGRAANRPQVTAFGREATTAVLVAGTLTFTVKGLVGRARPMSAAPGDADIYRPGRGFLDARRASFPSGHTAASFALATVIASELPHDKPLLRWGAGALAYGGAGLVGFSRVYGDRHWTSDVIMGAGLGIVAGRIAVRREHARASALDRLAQHAVVAPEPGRGVRLSVSLPFR